MDPEQANTDSSQTNSITKEAQSPPAQAPPSFPEGGTRAWITLFGAWLVQFSTFGYTNAFGVYQDFYVREYLTNKTSSQISLIGSVQLLLALSSGLVVGKLFDAGYFHHLMIGGALLSSFCLFMLSLSQPNQYYQIFLSQGLGQGLAIGMTFIPSVGIGAHYFQKYRGLAMGVVVSGASLGGALHPIMLNKLIFGKVGFHTGVRASAGLNLGVLFFANLMMRTRLPPNKGPRTIPIKDFARDPAYIFTVLGSFLTMAGLFFPIFFIQLDAVKHGIDPNLAFYTLAILNGASFFGRIIPSLLVQRLGVYNLIIPCTLICGILTFCLLAIHNAAGTVLFSVFYGFFSGAFVSLLSPMVSSLARNFSEIGARMGICFTWTGIAGFIGTPIAGALLSTNFSWWRPTIFAGVVLFAGSASLFVARLLFHRSRGK